jgi:Tfp pilus assembly protein PilN
VIRINLLPAKRKPARGATTAPVPGTRAAAGGGGGQIWFVLMFLTWAGLVGAGWWLVSVEEDALAAIRANAAGKTKEAEKISKEIDEAGLEARKQELAQLTTAIDKLESKRKSPVYVMYELAMILTDAKDSGGPDVDEEKQKQILKADPNSKVNDRWDPSGLWLTSVEEKNGTLVMEGAARDASDLSEFTRRLRVSARFGAIKHPDFTRVGTSGDGSEQQYLEWKLDVAVSRWD